MPNSRTGSRRCRDPRAVPSRAERIHAENVTNSPRECPGAILSTVFYCPGIHGRGRYRDTSSYCREFSRDLRSAFGLPFADIGPVHKTSGTLDALGRPLHLTANGVLRRFTKCVRWEESIRRGSDRTWVNGAPSS